MTNIRLYLIFGIFATGILFILILSALSSSPEKKSLQSEAKVIITPTVAPIIFRQLGALVAGFPEVPIYPSSRLVSSYEKKDTGKVGYEAVWATEGNLPQVISFYLAEFPRLGWTLEEVPPPGDRLEEHIKAVKNGQTAYLTVEYPEEKDEPGPVQITIEIPLT